MKTTFVSVLASLCCLLTHLSFTRVLGGVKNLGFLLLFTRALFLCPLSTATFKFHLCNVLGM